MRLREARFFADQNLDQVVVAQLRRDGVDIATAEEAGLARAPDAEILDHAMAPGLILVTHATGFGEMVFRQGRSNRGVLLLRPGHADPEQVLSLIKAALETNVSENLAVFVTAYASPTGPAIRVRRSARNR